MFMADVVAKDGDVAMVTAAWDCLLYKLLLSGVDKLFYKSMKAKCIPILNHVLNLIQFVFQQNHWGTSGGCIISHIVFYFY